MTARPSLRRRVHLGTAILLLGGTAVAVLGSAASPARVAAGGPPLLITPTALAFGDVPVGSTTAEQSVSVTNETTAPIVLSGSGGGAGAFGGSQDCQGQTLAAGASCHMYYAFSPTATGADLGSTNGTWNGQSFKLNFSGTGTPQFLIAPTTLPFGSVAVGGTAPAQTVTVTNRADRSVVMSGSGGGAGVFGGSQNCQGETLAAGASCQMYYAFSPTATGAASGTTSGTWNGQSFKLNFSGSGTPQFLITPTTLAMGRVAVGKTGPAQTVTITNQADRSVVMSGSGGGAGVFGGSQNCQGGTLAAGASCQMFYAFTPSATGPVSGSTHGTWNSQSFTINFSGVGIP